MRRPIAIGLGTVAALAVAHSALWRWAEGRMESGFADWAAAQRRVGWTISSDHPMQTGWPFHVALDIPNLAITAGPADMFGGLHWEVARLGLAVSMFHPRSLTVVPDGLERLRVGTLPEIAIRADSIGIAVPLDPNNPSRRAEVRATHLRVGLPDAEPGPGFTFALLQAQFEWRPDATQSEPALRFAGSAQDIALPPPPGAPPTTVKMSGIAPGAAAPAEPASTTPAWPLGPRVASFSIEGALTGPISRAADLRARAMAWRDGGGTLEIKRLALGWGPLGLSSSATIAMDEQLQPMGAGAVHLIGQNEAIDALAAEHIITVNAATAGKAMLGLVAHAPEGGGASAVDVPISLQRRVVAAGRVPITKLPVIAWQAPAEP